MIRRNLSVLLALILACISCEKDGVLHPNFVVLSNPEITSFEPQSGKPGTTVNVYGNYFSDQPANIVVSIGDFITQPGSHTMNHLTFVVPVATLTTSDRIFLSVNGKGTYSMTDFTIITPWNLETPYPITQYNYYDHAAFAENNKGYIINQEFSGALFGSNSLSEYDPLSNTWSRKADMPGDARYHLAHFVIGKKTFAGLGYTESFFPEVNNFYEYEQETDSWVTRSNFPGGKRYDAIGFQIGGKGYLAGGTDGNFENSMELWEYDPALDSWARKNDMPFTLSNAVETSGISYLTDFEGNVYNYYPETDYYQKITSNDSLSLFKGFGLQGNLYFFEEPQRKGAWKFDVARAIWSKWEGPFPSSEEHSRGYLSLDSIGLLIDFSDEGRMYSFTPENSKR